MNSPPGSVSASVSPARGLRPKLIICDEAVSVLDVPLRAQVLGFLEDSEVSYLFIRHYRAVVKNIVDRLAVRSPR